MHLYSVYDACDKDRHIALLDGAGRHHLARIASVLPRLSQELEGEQPAIGFSLLLSSSGEVFRAVFEVINQGPRIDLPQAPRRSRHDRAATA